MVFPTISRTTKSNLWLNSLAETPIFHTFKSFDLSAQLLVSKLYSISNTKLKQYMAKLSNLLCMCNHTCRYDSLKPPHNTVLGMMDNDDAPNEWFTSESRLRNLIDQLKLLQCACYFDTTETFSLFLRDKWQLMQVELNRKIDDVGHGLN